MPPHTHAYGLPHHRSFTHSHPHPKSDADPNAFRAHTHADGLAHSHPHLRTTHTDAKSYFEPDPYESSDLPDEPPDSDQ